MKIGISDALFALGIEAWVLRGEPTTEDEFNQMFRKITGADKNNSAIESADPKDFGTTWKAVSDKKKVLEDAEPMRLLREERNKRLSETDWMASSDLTLADNWKTYRQSLRDAPAQSGVTGLDDVTWPTKPS